MTADRNEGGTDTACGVIGKRVKWDPLRIQPQHHPGHFTRFSYLLLHDIISSSSTTGDSAGIPFLDSLETTVSLLLTTAVLVMGVCCVLLSRHLKSIGRNASNMLAYIGCVVGFVAWFIFGIPHIMLAVFVISVIPALRRQDRPNGSHESLLRFPGHTPPAEVQQRFQDQQRIKKMFEAITTNDEQLKQLATRGRRRILPRRLRKR